MLKFFNTLSGQLEEFRPMVEGEAKLYVCGPTVWDFAHIGNFRTMAAFGDVLRRHLKYRGYRVTHVMNITDVEDRIIKFSAERGQTIDEYTSKYTEAFLEDFGSKPSSKTSARAAPSAPR
jgi:cysteinyl-tRNA synthetase